ncbi:MAG: hypothetical protein CR977_00170 [Gammaproteobacteria bacterium]|nr:MAG: hypothetical protein CR977_00170 [Gammaproteobacteria bacterium]
MNHFENVCVIGIAGGSASGKTTIINKLKKEFVEPSKRYADIIIPRGGENTAAITILVEHLNTLLRQR